MYASSILHVDFLDLVTLGTRDGTRHLKLAMRNAILKNEREGPSSRDITFLFTDTRMFSSAISLAGAIKILPQSKYAELGDAELKSCIFHLTPLLERDGQVGAYVCILSVRVPLCCKITGHWIHAFSPVGKDDATTTTKELPPESCFSSWMAVWVSRDGGGCSI